MSDENEKITTKSVIDNLGDFLSKLKPLNINKRTSLSPFTLGFFEWWANHLKINNVVFEAQCERDLNKKWVNYITETTKIPDCLKYRDTCRELLNVDCTWVLRNSGPYYETSISKKQVFPTIRPFQSYIYLAVEHAEDKSIILDGSNLGSVMTDIRKLGYLKSLYNVVIYKPFKDEKIKNENKIQEQLGFIEEEIKLIGLNQEKERMEKWLIIMLFYHEKNSIVPNKKDLFLRRYELDRAGKVISKGENDKNYYEYKITDFYA